MKLRSIITLATAMLTLAAVAVVGGTPASAQSYRHGGDYHRAFVGGGGYHHHAFVGGDHYGYNGGDRHNFLGGYNGGHARYYSHPRYYGHTFVGGWQPGPGYRHYSWAWYQRHSAYWRTAHPYHGSPTLGIWLRL